MDDSGVYDRADLASWLRDRLMEHVGSVCTIEENLRAGNIVAAGMDIVQLRHMLNLNIDHARTIFAGTRMP